jgi:hypothetical protein
MKQLYLCLLSVVTDFFCECIHANSNEKKRRRERGEIVEFKGEQLHD